MLAGTRFAMEVALLVAALVGCTTAAPTSSSSPTTGPTSAPTATPVATAPPTPTAEPTLPGGFPASVLGLPVLSVDAASTLLFDGALDGRFAAIGGYWRQYFLPCPYQAHLAPLSEDCGFGVLTDDPLAYENPLHMGQSPGRLSPAMVTESAASFGLGRGDNPKMVAIVHVADPRQWQCWPEQRDLCRQRPVFDRVAWLNGQDVDPAQFQPDISTNMTFEVAVAAASAGAGGGQVALAYPLDAHGMQDVDPRFVGLADGLVWYARVIAGDAGPDGSAPGVDVLLDDATGTVISTLPLALDATYNPARVVVDSNGFEGTGEARPRFAVSAGDGVVATGWLDSSSTPLALEPGDYTVRAFIGTMQANPVAGPSCDLSLTVAAGADVAYYADFSGHGDCRWKTGTWPFR